MNELAKRIDQICEARRLNYKQLAEILGVSPPAIYQLVSGKNNNPTVAFIEKFKVVNVNIAWLLTGTGNMFMDDSIEESPKNNTDFLIKQLEQKDMIIQQKDNLIQTLQKIIESQLLPLGKWLDVSYSRFVFFMSLKNKFRYINVMI